MADDLTPPEPPEPPPSSSSKPVNLPPQERSNRPSPSGNPHPPITDPSKASPAIAASKAKSSVQSSWMIVAGGGMAFASAFLPWATVGPFTINGTDGDGQITLVLGVILAVLGAIRLIGKGGKAISWVAAGVAGAIGLIGAYHFNNLDSEVSSVGIGVYGTIAAGVVGFIGGMTGRQYKPATQAASTAPPPVVHPPAGWHTDPLGEGQLR